MAAFSVSNTILSPSGGFMSGVNVNIKLMPSGGFKADSKHELVREINVVTNAAGTWTASLESNNNILPTGSWYEILEKVPKASGGYRTHQIRVQTSGGNIYDLLV